MPGLGGTIDDAAMQLDYGYKHLLPTQASLGASGSLGAGTPVIEEISTFALGGGAMDAADEFHWLLMVKGSEINFTRDIQARVLMTSDDATADSGIVFKAAIKGHALGVAPTDSNATPDGAITFDAITVSATAFLTTATEWRGFGLTPAQLALLALDEFLGVVCELDSIGTADADDVRLIAMQLRYTRTLESADGVRKFT